MTKPALFFLCALTICGCKPTAQTAAPATMPSAAASTNTSLAILFDQVLAREDIARRIQAAEQDLAKDKWLTNLTSGICNVSRMQRETPIADDILGELRPRLEKLNAAELVDQLKTLPATSEIWPEGVAYNVYMNGNKKIIELLNKQTKAELGGLQKFEDDNHVVFTGEDGTAFSVGDLVRREMLRERK